MKILIRSIPLWLVLGGLSALLASASEETLTRLPGVTALLLLPVLAAWLTAGAVAALPARGPRRIAFWLPTVLGWSALIILVQGRTESNDVQRSIILLAVEFMGVISVWLAIKARRLPSWRVVGEAVGALAVLTVLGAVVTWGYEARTRSIAARAEARWAEIGHPMSEFEKTLTSSRENAGSQVLRQVLREQVNSLYYKNGTRAASLEPALDRPDAAESRIKHAVEVVSLKLPPSDDFDISSQSFASTESVNAELDESYRRMLATEPARWASDPQDGYLMSVPNFHGIRQFAQVIAADALRRLAAGDQDGAARALAAGLRLRKGLVENPTLVSLMIAVAVDGLLSSKQVRLPASEDGLSSLPQDVATMRAEFQRRLQMEAWASLRQIHLQISEPDVAIHLSNPLPEWADKFLNAPWFRRQCANAALNEAEYMAIEKSPTTMTLPDLGASLHEAISEANPSVLEMNPIRAIMRTHATLLLREQTELIRDTRARLDAGRPIESRDSVVLPGLRWELNASSEKRTVSTRLIGVPEWIAKKLVSTDDFWLLPLDGSVTWQFHLPGRTTSRN